MNQTNTTSLNDVVEELDATCKTTGRKFDTAFKMFRELYNRLMLDTEYKEHQYCHEVALAFARDYAGGYGIR